ncbi:MAG: SNF2-related protein [bacterium]|nr:SNF2-related protein [bacterium]
MSTAYHARYFAHELTRQGGKGVDRLSRSLFDACVDLNPHQIDAALFALRSPLLKGVLFADEVGLGKTIEAGLVLCQYWAENRRKLMVVCPASIRKQWSLELEEKFNLPTIILDASTVRQLQKEGNPAPFVSDRIVITSINYASAMQVEIRPIQWDLIVIDEAHKLRSAYRSSNKMGQRIRWALEPHRKLLVTATPLQNSLLELYGLSTIIDEHLFGDRSAFQAMYMRQDSDLEELRARLQYFCKRTLRKQVVEYIQYTERKPITRKFAPSEDEHQLYEAISNFLHRPDTYSIPTEQRTLITLILRKLLASSSHAIAGTLQTMKDRLVKLRSGLPVENLAEQIILGEEIEDEYLDETLAEEDEQNDNTGKQPEPDQKVDLQKLNAEIGELDRYIGWAKSIGVDTKSQALLKALEAGFKELLRMGAKRKALIFTESRRTQEYLKGFLEANGYLGQIVLFNGSNSGPEAKAIYERWLADNKGTGRSTGSRIIDIRTALIEYFRDYADIMIATEAAAEGVNLQFCSQVVNYDLPWNPQRIEQRIGRCHRYGQKFDVVVINFLNESNHADCRVLELLTDKFNLFSGIFGASDEVLGAIESGVDFEKRILEIYQQCRTPDEIEAAFKQLQQEMDEVIQIRMRDTRRQLLEHFDEDVHTRLKVQLDEAKLQLDHIGKLFWTLTQFMLSDHAKFNDKDLTFDLYTAPRPDLACGTYHLISKSQDNVPGSYLYRLSHPLGEHVLETGKSCATPFSQVTFDVTNHPTKISAVEAINGKSGFLTLQKLVVQSFEREEYLLFSAFDDSGKSLDQETAEKLFRCQGNVSDTPELPLAHSERLEREAKRHTAATIAKSLEANNRHFLEERERLEKWAEDKVIAAEKELADTKAQIKAHNRLSRLAATTDDQHTIQLKIRDLEKLQRRQRQKIFDVEDEIKEKRDNLIEALEKRLAQSTGVEPIFTLRWSVI